MSSFLTERTTKPYILRPIRTTGRHRTNDRTNRTTSEREGGASPAHSRNARSQSQKCKIGGVCRADERVRGVRADRRAVPDFLKTDSVNTSNTLKTDQDDRSVNVLSTFVPKQPIRNIKKNHTALYKAIQKEPKSEPSGALALKVVSHLISGNPTEPFGRLIRAKRRTKDWNHHDRMEPAAVKHRPLTCASRATLALTTPRHLLLWPLGSRAQKMHKALTVRFVSSTTSATVVRAGYVDRLVSRATVLRTEQ